MDLFNKKNITLVLFIIQSIILSIYMYGVKETCRQYLCLNDTSMTIRLCMTMSSIIIIILCCMRKDFFKSVTNIVAFVLIIFQAIGLFFMMYDSIINRKDEEEELYIELYGSFTTGNCEKHLCGKDSSHFYQIGISIISMIILVLLILK